MSDLIHSVPTNTACTFDGFLYQEMMRQLRYFNQLEYLGLRASDRYSTHAIEVDFERYLSPAYGSDVKLDFYELRGFQNFRVLRVAGIASTFLIDGIIGLSVIELEACAAIWVSHIPCDNSLLTLGDSDDKSPIAIFLAEWSRKLAKRHGSLSTSLKALSLRDHYHHKNPFCEVLMKTLP